MAGSPNFPTDNPPFYFYESPDVEHVTESPDIGPSSNPAPSSGRRRTSGVWQFYDIVEFPNKGPRAVCKKCKKDFSCQTSGGTGHLKRHADKHAAKPHDPTQTQISFTDSSIGNFIFNNENARKEIAKFIIQNEQPFYLAENPAFIKMLLRGFNPNFKSVSRNTMRKYCLVIYDDYRQKVISEISSGSFKIALTSDIWTSQFKTNYICVTAHYVDHNWNLQKRILSFFELEFRHTASVIASYITRAIKEYNIENYIFSITLDNASANNSAVDILKMNLMPMFSGVLFHVRCACHVLNLCVKDGLKIIEPHISKVRNCILFVRNGSHRRHEFQTYCKEMGRKCKRYLIDVDHRWNSTYEMLDCAYDDRDLISMFYNDRSPEDQVTNYDWEVSNLIKEFLEIFYNATNLFSGVYYPTSCITINQIYFISEVFAKYRYDSNFSPIVAPMELKFKKYFGKIEPLPVLSMILDPRFKIDGTFCIIDAFDENMDLDHSSQKENFRCLFYDMYNEYHRKYGNRRGLNLSSTSENTSSSSKSRSTAHVVNIIKRKFAVGASSSSSSNIGSTSSHELNLYLNNNFNNFLSSEEIDNFNILSWWKEQENNYPVLAAMARDILTPPMSTVASESCFSAGKRVLDDRRSRMNQQTVQMCICLKDWLDAEDRIQDQKINYTADDGGLGIYTDVED